jgi:hypothetical protein
VNLEGTTMPGPTEQDLATASQRVLHMFVAVCGAPDDPEVAHEAAAALRDLETMLRSLS